MLGADTRDFIGVGRDEPPAVTGKHGGEPVLEQLRDRLALFGPRVPAHIAAGLEAPSVPIVPIRSQVPELTAFAIFGLTFIALGGLLLLRKPATAPR